jgi:NADP-dependent 3-hydroxy acid dehydrogenase YdfG/acyl carrier protein
VDVDTADLKLETLRAALHIPNEPELALREDTALVPRLRRIISDDDRVTSRASLGEGTLLITGGTGGLGSLLARHLVTEHGVAHLLLSSRRGPDAEGASELVTELLALGAETAEVVACDVADPADITRALAGIDPTRPLTGVIHLAGVLDDGVVSGMTPESLQGVLAPKVNGAWNLHQATCDHSLESFILFSSVAGMFGNPAQGNYSAANLFLDALAAHRRAQGQSGLSLAWGAWAGGGMLDTLSDAEQQRIQRSGLTPLTPEQGLQLFDDALEGRESVMMTANLDHKQLQRQATEGMPVPWILRGLISAPSRGDSAAAGAAALALRQRLGAAPETERHEILLEVIQDEVAQVLGLSSGHDVDADMPLQELGADSLMAIELYNRLSALSGTTLPSTLVFDYPNTGAITGFILTQIELPSEDEARDRSLHQSLVEAVRGASLEDLEASGTLALLKTLAGVRQETLEEKEPVTAQQRTEKTLEERADEATEDELLAMLEASLDDLDGEQ